MLWLAALGPMFAGVAAAGTAPRTTPVPVPPAVAAQVRLERVVSGLARPVGLVWPPGNDPRRGYVVEEDGRVRLLDLSSGTASAAPFLDVSDRMSRGDREQGLLGLAFHPRFQENGKVYVNFTDRRGDTNVVEFVTDPSHPDAVARGRERQVLFVRQPYVNHNGGDLVFGPDGRLWIGLGDGGSGGDPHGNGQNDAVLLAKMLVVDVDTPDARPVVFAKGLRNPWRYAFDRRTQDLWIADVGQNAWEEIDVLLRGTPAGANLGWNIREGRHCYRNPACSAEGMVEPVLEYGHDDGCSVTGGFVYRGRAILALDGAYFFADFCTAILRSFRWSREHGVTDYWDWRAALDPEGRLAAISTFGEDPEGELWIVSLDGVIWKLVPRP